MLTTTTAPAALLDSTDAVLRQHLRLEDGETDDDDLIDALCLAAVRFVEAFTRRRLVTQEVRLTLDGFPCGQIRLPVDPVRSVALVSYVDWADETQTFASDQYRLVQSGLPSTLATVSGVAWPAAKLERAVVFIDLVVGFGDAADVPADIVQAVRMLVGHWYLHREAVSSEAPENMPFSIRSLLDPWRLWL